MRRRMDLMEWPLMPDGRILYTATRSGSVDIWIMNPDGSGQTQLTSNEGNWNGRSPKSLPTGVSSSFHQRDPASTNFGAWVRTAVIRGCLRNSSDPAFRATVSADGKWVFYNTENTGSSCGKSLLMEVTRSLSRNRNASFLRSLRTAS